jgi:hypothetical protein
MPILILTALHHEARAIRTAIRRIDTPVRIELIGPGATLLSKMEKRPICGLIMAGVAGGIAPDLQTGDVVIDELSVVQKMPREFRKGRIYSAQKIIATPQEKADIFHRTGAMVVDMENESARDLARDWGIPFLGIRTVLDGADETLDPALLRLMDQHGRVRIGRLLAELTTHPALLKNLWQLRNQSAIALHNLGDAVLRIVQLGWMDEKNSTGGSRPL